MAKSLWGDLSTLEVVRNPRSILQEQADELTRATGGLLEGEVRTLSQVDDRIDHQLRILAPGLNNYSVTILFVSHSMALYPVFVRSEVPSEIETSSCPDEKAFEAELAKRLSSPQVRTLLSRLKSMVVSE